MVKQIFAKLLISTFLLTGSALTFAQELSLGYTIDYVFQPNEPQDLVNNFFFTIEANCKIESTDESDDILGKILSGSGSLNSNKLNKGEEITLTVRNKDTLHIVAPSGSKVRLTNLGLNELTAKCSPA